MGSSAPLPPILLPPEWSEDRILRRHKFRVGQEEYTWTEPKPLPFSVRYPFLTTLAVIWLLLMTLIAFFATARFLGYIQAVGTTVN